MNMHKDCDTAWAELSAGAPLHARSSERSCPLLADMNAARKTGGAFARPHESMFADVFTVCAGDAQAHIRDLTRRKRIYLAKEGR